jgi:hypothetical protein
MPRLTSDFSSDFRDYDTDEIVVVTTEYVLSYMIEYSEELVPGAPNVQ